MQLTTNRFLTPLTFHCAKRLDVSSLMQGVIYTSTGLLIVLALVAGGRLLLSDLAPHGFVDLPHAPLSAAPLLLIGAASLGFQVLTRPRPPVLFKALLVSLAFILWGIDQMLPPGRLTTTIWPSRSTRPLVCSHPRAITRALPPRWGWE